MPTLKDIAKETGLALSTISTVLNNKKTQIPISSETKERVWEAARRIGYYPNLMARSLRSRKSNTVGIAFASSFEEFSDPTASLVLSGIGSVFDRTDYNLLMFSGYEDIKERSVAAARGMMVDGLLYIVYTSVYEYFRQDIAPALHEGNIPFLGIQFYKEYSDVNSVALEAAEGGRMAVRHLSGAGYRDIGIINTFGSRSLAGRELGQGAVDELRRLGLQTAGYWEPGGFNGLPDGKRSDSRYRAGLMIALQLKNRGAIPRAVFITGDIHAGGFIDGLRQAGLRVPEDVAVMGYGNQLGPERGRDFLSTIDPCYRKNGAEAGRLLLDILEEKKERRLTEPVVLQPELVIRHSCGARN